MIRLDARILARGSCAVFASAVVAWCAGCTGGVYARPAYVGAQPIVAGPVEDDSDVAYVPDPPVEDIASYPTLFYGGVQVYYVGGYWYHQGPRGWAYYREEPADLGRQRQERWQRDHEPRWGDQRGEEPRGQEQRGTVPEPPPRGVTEAQPPDRRGPPEVQPQPRRVEVTPPPPPPAPIVQARRKVVPPPPVVLKRAPPRRAVPPKQAPQPPEHR